MGKELHRARDLFCFDIGEMYGENSAKDREKECRIRPDKNAVREIPYRYCLKAGSELKLSGSRSARQTSLDDAHSS